MERFIIESQRWPPQQVVGSVVELRLPEYRGPARVVNIGCNGASGYYVTYYTEPRDSGDRP